MDEAMDAIDSCKDHDERAALVAGINQFCNEVVEGLAGYTMAHKDMKETVKAGLKKRNQIIRDSLAGK